MPSTDNRIVGLQFDNDKFESNVQQTLKSLEELKKGLEFKDSGEGLDDVQKKIDSMNLEKMANAIEQVSERFSTMGIIGMQVLTRLADAAIDTGKKMADALVFKPIRDGFQEHEQLADITKVLLYTGKGSIEEIQATMAQLNKFADDTIYKFGHMTSNLPRFTNQNISLQDSADALQGVALFAALAGASTENYASSADALSRSLGKGVVQQREWMRIRAAHMDTSDFKQLALDFAALNGVIEEGTYSLETFEDFIKDGKFTSKVLMDTLLHISDSTTEIGQRAWKAATEVHKFTMLVDVLGEALQTGWADTLGIIIGNYEEATQFWTGIKNFFEEIIETATAARNAIFQEWKDLGGRDNIMAAFWSGLLIVKNIIDEIKSAWTDVFGTFFTGERLANISHFLAGIGIALIRWLFDPLEDGRTRVQKFGDVLRGIFSVVKFFIDIIRLAWYVITAFVEALNIGGALSSLWGWLSGLGTEFLNFVTNAERIEKVTESFEKLKDKAIELGKGISDFFSGIWDSLQYIFNPIVSKDLEGNTIRLLDTLQGHLGDPTILGLYIDGVKKRLKEKITELGADIKKWLLGAWEDIVAGAMVIGDAFSLLWDAIFHPERAVDKNIKAKEGDMFPGKEDPLSRYRNFITNFGTSLRELGIAIGDKIAAFVEDIPRMLSVLGSALSLLWKAIFNPASAIDYNIKAKENDIFGGKEDPLSRSRLFITKLGFSLRSLGIMVGDKVVEFVSNLPKIASDVFTAITDYLFPTKGKRLPDGRLAYEKASVGAAGGYAKLIEDDKLINRMGRKFAEWGRIVADFGVSLLSKLPGILESIGNFFGPIWESIKNWLSEHIPQPIKDAYHTVMGFLDPIIAPFKAFGTKLWTKIKHIFEVPGGKTDASKTFLQRLKEQFATPEGVHAYLDSVWTKIKIEFEKIKKWFLEKTEGIRTFLSDLFAPKLKEGIDEAAEDMAQEGAEEAADGFFGTIGNILKSIWAWLTKIDTQFNIASIASFGGLIALVVTLAKMFLNVSSAAKNMAQSAKFKNQKFYHTFAGQVAIIVGAVIALYFVIERAGQLDAKTFSTGAWRIAGILAVVALLAYFMNRNGKKIESEGKGGIGSNLGISMLAMVGSLILMAVAIRMFAKIIQDIVDEKLNVWVVIGAIGAIVVILAILMGLMKLFSGTKFSGKMDWKPIIAIAVAIVAIAWALAPIGALPESVIKKSRKVLTSIAFALGALMLVNKLEIEGVFGKGDWKPIVAIAAAFVAIASVLISLSVLSDNSLSKALDAMHYIRDAITMIMLINKIEVGGVVGRGNWQSIISSAAAIWIVADALTKFTDFTDDDIAKAKLMLFNITLVLGILSNINFQQSTLMDVISQALTAIEAMALIWVLSQAIKEIKDVPTETVQTFVTGVTGIILAITAQDFLSTLGTKNLGTIMGTAVSYGGAIWLIRELSSEIRRIDADEVDTDRIEAFIGGVSRIIGAMGGMLAGAGLAAAGGKMAVVALGAAIGIGALVGALLHHEGIRSWATDTADYFGDIIGTFQGAADGARFKKLADAINGIETGVIDEARTQSIIDFLDALNTFLVKINTEEYSITTINDGVKYVDAWALPSTILLESLGILGSSFESMTRALNKDFDPIKFKTDSEAALLFVERVREFLSEFDKPENNVVFDANNEFYKSWNPDVTNKPSDLIIEAMGEMGKALGEITSAIAISGSTAEFEANQTALFAFLDKLQGFMENTKAKTDKIDGFAGWWGLFWGTQEESGIQKIIHGMGVIGTAAKTFGNQIQGLGTKQLSFKEDSEAVIDAVEAVGNVMLAYSEIGKIENISEFFNGIQALGDMGNQVRIFMDAINMAEGPIEVNKFKIFAEGISEIFTSLSTLTDVFAVSAATNTPIDEAFGTLFSNAIADGLDMAGITSALQQTGVDLVNHIAVGIEAPKTALPKAFQFILDYIKAEDILPYTTTITGVLKALGVALIDLIANGIEEATDRLINALKSILAKMVAISEGRNYFNAMFASGRWYGLGLADGLWSTYDRVSKAATALAEVIMRATDTSLSISSPSKKGVASGEFFGDGLSIGIQNRYRKVRQTAKSLGTTIVEAVNKRLGIQSPATESQKQAAMYISGWDVGLVKNTEGPNSVLSKSMNWFGNQLVEKGYSALKLSAFKSSIYQKPIDVFHKSIATNIKTAIARNDQKVGKTTMGYLWDLYNDKKASSFLTSHNVSWDDFIQNSVLQQMADALFGKGVLGGSVNDALNDYVNAVGGGGGGRGGGGGGGSYGAASQVAIDDMSRKDMMLNLEQQFDKIAHKLDSLQIVLDDGTLVGRIMPTIDQRLGEAIQLEARR